MFLINHCVTSNPESFTDVLQLRTQANSSMPDHVLRTQTHAAVAVRAMLPSTHLHASNRLMRKNLPKKVFDSDQKREQLQDMPPWHTVHSLPVIRSPLVFFGPYSGKLPSVFPMNVASMRANVDCCTFVVFHVGNEDPAEAVSMINIAGEWPVNLHLVHAKEAEFENEFAKRVGRPVNASMLTGRQLGRNHKWNDVRVASPIFFADKIGPEVQFWGHLEFDMIYGRLSPLVQQVGQNFDLWTGMTWPNGALDRVSAPLMLMRTGEVTHKLLSGLIKQKT